MDRRREKKIEKERQNVIIMAIYPTQILHTLNPPCVYVASQNKTMYNIDVHKSIKRSIHQREGGGTLSPKENSP